MVDLGMQMVHSSIPRYMDGGRFRPNFILSGNNKKVPGNIRNAAGGIEKW